MAPKKKTAPKKKPRVTGTVASRKAEKEAKKKKPPPKPIGRPKILPDPPKKKRTMEDWGIRSKSEAIALIPKLSRAEQIELIEVLEADAYKRKTNKIHEYFPAGGPLRRDLYRAHMAFFNAGAEHRERLILAGNRVGKTVAGAFETTLHATGEYPDWWQGKRFTSPTNIVVAGDTAQTVRDVIQMELLGAVNDHGTGMIPKNRIKKTRPKAGNISDAVESIYVEHVSGGVSSITLKSYAEGRISFQGTARHVVWLDEEPPFTVYEECLLRTMTTNGIVMLTFTPLKGMSDVVLAFLPDGKLPEDGYMVTEADAA